VPLFQPVRLVDVHGPPFDEIDHRGARYFAPSKSTPLACSRSLAVVISGASGIISSLPC
jgi:hypothetical protein